METAVTATAIHRVSVIICAYTEERWDDLMRSVSNAAETLIDDDELIVVIDHNAALLARAQPCMSNLTATISACVGIRKHRYLRKRTAEFYSSTRSVSCRFIRRPSSFA